MSQSRPKVFGIGFHKTGTKSLGNALAILGYRVTGPNGVLDLDITHKALPIARALVPRFDAFQDNPWPILFREMDAFVPGSKFILTIRPTDEWLRSATNFFGAATTPMRRWIYGDDAGSPIGNEDLYRARYDRHNADVREHFASQPDDLLIMDLAQANWTPLCRFLGHEVPDRPFPHMNAGRKLS